MSCLGGIRIRSALAGCQRLATSLFDRAPVRLPFLIFPPQPLRNTPRFLRTLLVGISNLSSLNFLACLMSACLLLRLLVFERRFRMLAPRDRRCSTSVLYSAFIDYFGTLSTEVSTLMLGTQMGTRHYIFPPCRVDWRVLGF